MRDDPPSFAPARRKHAEYTPPAIRLQFSQRLRAFRTARGFKRARAFATALELEENRYTRYERAEVEPTLTVLCRMCDLLGATPNDLLGFEPVQEARASLPATANLISAHEALAWKLASAITAIRSGTPGPGNDDAIAAQRRTAAAFRDLMARPLEAACALLDDPVLERADAGSRSALAELMGTYLSRLSEAAAPERA